MGRMHSGAQGKSSSKRPMQSKKPSWVRHTSKEVELLVAKLAKEGNSSSQIGLILRDNYGIPDVRQVTDKKISALLRDKKLAPSLPEDLRNLIRRSSMIRKHLEDNKQDRTAKRGLQLTESKIKRLVNYYKQSGKLEVTWKYDPRKASTYLE